MQNETLLYLMNGFRFVERETQNPFLRERDIMSLLHLFCAWQCLAESLGKLSWLSGPADGVCVVIG